MKTWEMIKELTENPEKKFRLKENNVVLEVVDGEIDLTDIDWILLEDEWEEVKKPVDFMTAFKAWDEEDKTIICQLDKDNTVKYEGNRTNFNFHAECIRRNEWYIED